ncbi:hypothetical protein [Brevibacillus formosus]|uniref:hypothetical protein n=1 Tax=Brevibacillus formosus TaxID=54913 RepID=UPI003F534743
MLEKVELEGFFVLTLLSGFLQIIERKGSYFLTVRILFVYIYIGTHVLVFATFAGLKRDSRKGMKRGLQVVANFCVF